ncbi:hypothetical protein AALP_AA3G236700 [Arabis alpina]|uniref:MATH domain-containing protein n=1 Tax=Arabis alpina TaxID=50452 RepID=A0A087HB74_ARAAL|nr:hypothetical protein AALP_AA3G236700 [Arabis alpina]
MTTYYTNTIYVAYLLFCLFITSSTSTRSFIQQFTDDFNTTLQQEVEAGPIQNLNHEIYSRVSALNPVRGFRDSRPSSYSIQMDSYNTLFKHNAATYESRPFAVGGYNWKLIVNIGNLWDMYVSVYVVIDSSTPIAPQQEVHADLRFYIYNKNERKYFTIQDTDVWKFSASRTKWGFPQVFSVDTFKDTKNGYVYDGDKCEFGVDVIIPSVFQKSEVVSITESFSNPKFTWGIQRISMQLKDSYPSDKFSIGGRDWSLLVYPNGYGSTPIQTLTLFLILNWNEKFSPFEKVFVEVILRVVNQRQLKDSTSQFCFWYSRVATMTGSYMISLSDLRDPSKGFIVNDFLKLEVEILAMSSTKFLPN